MDLSDICLTTGIKALLGTWVAIKVSQRVYKMYLNLRSKRTSKFSSGNIKKCRSQVGKNIQVGTLRDFSDQEEVKHQTTPSVVKDKIEGNKNAEDLSKGLVIGMIRNEEKDGDVPYKMKVEDNPYLSEMELSKKDIINNRVDLPGDMDNKNSFDKLDNFCKNMEFQENGEDFSKNIEAEAQIICLDNVMKKEHGDKENKTNNVDIEDLLIEDKYIEILGQIDNNSVRMTELELIKESPQNLSDANINMKHKEGRKGGFKKGEKTEKFQKAKIPEIGFHFVKVHIPDDEFEKEKLTEIENEKMSVIIRNEFNDEFSGNEVKPSNQSLDKTETSPQKVLVYRESLGKPNQELTQKVNDMELCKESSIPISLETHMNNYSKSQQKKAIVSLKKLKFPGITKVTGNEEIQLNCAVLGRNRDQKTLATTNVDHIPFPVVKHLSENDNMKLKRRLTGTLKKSLITSDMDKKNKLPIRKTFSAQSATRFIIEE